MKEEDKDVIVAVLLVFSILFAGTFLMTNAAMSYHVYYEVVDSEIINTNIIQDDEGEIEYIEITFANGKIYKIRTNKDIDLTVNSRLVIEFANGERRNWFWEEFEPEDDIYSINQIIKVPDNAED